MELLTDDRAQALQVGAVLLFGILVILFAVWQAFVIPDQNERVEFTHNQQVQSEMVELRGDIVSTADANTPTSASVELGTQFPTRLLFVNPSPAAGNLQTESVGDGEFVLGNAVAAEEGSGEGAFWNGTDRDYETTSLEYSPEYRVFQGAPDTMYDSTVAYNLFERADEGTSALSQQAIIDGDTITLVSLVGDYSESGVGSVTPDVQPVSTQSRTVAVENSTEGNITIELSTKLNESQWDQLLDVEPNVVDVEAIGEDIVEIELAEGQYELRMARVGVGQGLVGTQPAYIEAVEGVDERVRSDQNHTVTVEVRDRFNVPQNNVNVTGEVDVSDGEIRPQNKTTNVDGQASFEYDPDDTLSDGDEVELEFAFAPAVSTADDAIENITVNVTIESPPGGFGGGNNSVYEIEFTDSDANIDCDFDENKCGLRPGESSGELTVTAEPDDPMKTPKGDVQFFIDRQELFDITPTTATLDTNAQAQLEIDQEGADPLEEAELVAFSGGSIDRIEFVQCQNAGNCPPE